MTNKIHRENKIILSLCGSLHPIFALNQKLENRQHDLQLNISSSEVFHNRQTSDSSHVYV